MAVLEQFKCPSCGGTIEFDAGTQKMKCPYCDSEFDVGAIQEVTEKQQNQKVDSISWEKTAGQAWETGETDGLMVYACQSCGGEIVGDKNMGATRCPYCGNQTVVTGQFSGTLRPDYIIPFKKNKKQAKEAFLEFISGNKYVPKLFKSEKHIDEIKGIYVPFWLFDADVHAEISFDAKKTRSRINGDYQITEEKTYYVTREGDVRFDNVPVDGSGKIADDMMESIEPFDFGDAVDFKTAYLAGFLADKYDVDAENSIERANARIKKSTEDVFMSTVGQYDDVTVSHSYIDLEGGKAEYALFPVWMLSATYKGKAYTFAMNGQTGKFAGDLPADSGALWKYFGKCTAIIGAALYAVSLVLMLI